LIVQFNPPALSLARPRPNAQSVSAVYCPRPPASSAHFKTSP
jgi:hypothetical protein